MMNVSEKKNKIICNQTQNWLGFPLRFGKDSEDNIWFVLKDVCTALGIKNSGNVHIKLDKIFE